MFWFFLENSWKVKIRKTETLRTFRNEVFSALVWESEIWAKINFFGLENANFLKLFRDSSNSVPRTTLPLSYPILSYPILSYPVLSMIRKHVGWWPIFTLKTQRKFDSERGQMPGNCENRDLRPPFLASWMRRMFLDHCLSSEHDWRESWIIQHVELDSPSKNAAKTLFFVFNDEDRIV